jgi:formylglycine-generating enzyme required for sulfatase activity
MMEDLVSDQDTVAAQRELIERLSSLEAARAEAERTAEATRKQLREQAASAAAAEQEHAKALLVEAQGLREKAAGLARLPRGEYEPSHVDGRPLDQLEPAVAYLRRVLPAQQQAIDALDTLRVAQSRASDRRRFLLLLAACALLFSIALGANAASRAVERRQATTRHNATVAAGVQATLQAREETATTAAAKVQATLQAQAETAATETALAPLRMQTTAMSRAGEETAIANHAQATAHARATAQIQGTAEAIEAAQTLAAIRVTATAEIRVQSTLAARMGATAQSLLGTLPSLASEGVSKNVEWEPVVVELDGVSMAVVPTGCFMMGSYASRLQGVAGEKVCFDTPFLIDLTEVTNEQFERLGGIARSNVQVAQAQHPRVSITWTEARAFCAVRGTRLPSEREWEYAARGPDGLNYPWGNEYDGRWGTGESKATLPTDVGTRPDGASWSGVLDMSGSVLEWIDIETPSSEEAALALLLGASTGVLRGGKGRINEPPYNVTVRDLVPVSLTSELVGLRCALPLK